MKPTRVYFRKDEDTPNALIVERTDLRIGHVLFKKGHLVCVDVFPGAEYVCRVATEAEEAFFDRRLAQFGLTRDREQRWSGCDD